MADVDYTQYKLIPLENKPKPDPRDYPPSVTVPIDVDAAIKAGQLPSEIDLCGLGLMPKPFDQGQEGSCGGHGTVEAHIANYMRTGAPLGERLSPAFVYYMGRLRQGWQNTDSGSNARDDLDSIVKSGACLEHFMPYVAGQFAVPPSAEATQDALNYLGDRYEQLPSWQYICAVLGSEKRPVVVTSYWYQEWYYPQNGFMVPHTSQPLGGHLYCYCGYKYLPHPQTGVMTLYARLHNSWGGVWGDGTGHAWVEITTTDADLWERWALYSQIEKAQPKPAPVTIPFQLTASNMSYSVTTALQVLRQSPSPHPVPVPPGPNDAALAPITTEFVQFARLLKSAGVHLNTVLKDVL